MLKHHAHTHMCVFLLCTYMHSLPDKEFCHTALCLGRFWTVSSLVMPCAFLPETDLSFGTRPSRFAHHTFLFMAFAFSLSLRCVSSITFLSSAHAHAHPHPSISHLHLTFLSHHTKAPPLSLHTFSLFYGKWSIFLGQEGQDGWVDGYNLKTSLPLPSSSWWNSFDRREGRVFLGG